MAPDYDDAYRGEAGYFGDDAEPVLARFADRIAPGGTALDIGVGQGRNALALARRGLRVTGIDAVPAAIEATAARAASAGLDASLWCGSFEAYAPASPFEAVLAFGLLQEMTPAQGAALCARMRDWCAPGGLVFAVAWHTGDPRFAELAADPGAERIGDGSFRLATGAIRTYLAAGELRARFADWELVHYWEGLGPEHRHGDGAPERHGVVELVARKPR